MTSWKEQNQQETIENLKEKLCNPSASYPKFRLAFSQWPPMQLT